MLNGENINGLYIIVTELMLYNILIEWIVNVKAQCKNGYHQKQIYICIHQIKNCK